MFQLTTFLASAATMIFEMTGARMLAPFLGTSIEVWSGLIATILGGLSIGSFLGGKIADRYPRSEVLALLVFLSGAMIAISWGMRDVVLSMFSLFPGSLTMITIGAGLILFFPASVFLGSISPFVAKLMLTNLSRSASTVGTLSALATVGSILGTIGATLWLIPLFGTSSILLSIAIFLVAFSLFLVNGSVRKKGAAGVFSLSLLFFFISFLTMGNAPSVIAEIDTPYSSIHVSESEDSKTGRTVRALSTDPFGTQCASYVMSDGSVSSELVFSYLKSFNLGFHFKPDAKKLLMIGGCNYSYPRNVLSLRSDAHFDVVEIDEEMTETARKYFGFSDDSRLQVFHEDARKFINRDAGPYDIIFTDAFNSHSAIPYQLSTKEAMERLSGLLSDDGVVVMNIIGSIEGETSDFLRAELTTVASVFPTVDVFQVHSLPYDEPQNIIFVAQKKPPASLRVSTDPDMNMMLQKLVPKEKLSGGILLTDDYAPVDTLGRAVREHAIRMYKGGK